MAKPVFINPVKRMVKQKGSLSALLVTGSDKVESGFGNGDCLFMDFSRLLFAVSDGSERHPNASRLLLERLADVLPAPYISFDIDALQDAIRKIYAAQKYTHKCTFSCVALVKKKREFTAYISSGGDSSVIVADSSDGSIIFKTASDMNFSGRSNKAPGISTFGLKSPGLKIILATDGFIEALNKIQKTEQGRLPEWLFKAPVCGIAGKFSRRFKAKKIFNYDDIGMMIIDPFAICRDDKTIVIGGTLPAKEALFASSFALRTGNWVEKERWPENADLFDSAVITIKDE
ncbi:MAG: hypothetical protein EHM85_08620 [Desulfobacteraceae bacterium]|nr:MAG: hypothetical protein EHM85_08620 [Desulfobacteraceae bacterium]